jgi:alpha,alpha-trehalase
MSQTTTTRFNHSEIERALLYIHGFWSRLERFRPHDEGTLVGLPRPYIVPSARPGDGFTFDEIYYWDSYFIAQAFVGKSRHQLAQGMTDDLLYLMRRFDIIPNGGRSYFTSRSHPPLLTTLILQVYRDSGDRLWLDQAMNTAKEEYRRVWMGTSQPNWRQVHHGLSRYYDANMLHDLAEAESGWDMTSRFERRCLDYLPADLNALLYKYETDFEHVALLNHDAEEAAEWHRRAKERHATMTKYLWDEEQGFFFDFNYKSGQRGPVWSLAGYYAMWGGMASKLQAARMVKNLPKFEFSGGLAATAAYPRTTSEMPEQWAYPNGWAPLQMIVVEGLERYGYRQEARQIARKWLQTNLKTFADYGEFYEKYNVLDPSKPAVEGVYPSQRGFGWTNAVFVRFCQLYLDPLEMPTIAAAGSPAKEPQRRGLRERLLTQPFFNRV